MTSPAVNAQNSMLHRILQTMVERQASDVYLSAQASVTFKIKGLSLPANLLWRLKNERASAAGAASLDVGHLGTLAPSFSGITLEVPAEPDGGVLPAVVESRRFPARPTDTME